MEFGNEKSDSAFSKKAFEIGYALVRLADSLGKDQFAGYLKSLGLEILHAVTSERYTDSLKTLRSIEYFVHLAGSTNAITSRNAELVAEEASTLHSAIIVHLENLAISNVHLESVFSQDAPSVLYTHKEKREFVPDNEVSEENSEIFAEIKPFEEVKEVPRSHADSSQIRQTAILQKIRQSGNCRMKEIQNLFPDVSERTLRYDLQNLIEQGMIERVGQSGPATYYRARVVSTA